MGVQARAVAQVNVQPAVIVVIEKSKAAALGFDDERLVFDATPHIGNSQSRLPSYVYAKSQCAFDVNSNLGVCETAWHDG